MVQKLNLSQMFDPKENRLPKKTGIGGKLRPIKSTRLFNPKLVRNPTLSKQLDSVRPTNPKVLREAALKKLSSSLDTINKHLRESQQFKGITFELNKDANRTFAVIKDQRTGEVLKEVPPEGVLQIAANLRDASGIIVSVEG